MRAEWVVSADRFAELESAWEALAEKHCSPFLRHPWFSAWWKAFGGSRELRVCTLWDEDTLAAAFPLCRSRTGLRPLTNAHSNSFALLARDDRARSELIEIVLSVSPRLKLDFVPEGDPTFDALIRSSQAQDRLLLVQPGPPSPTVDTRGELSEYWWGLSGNARRDFRRCRRLLDGLRDVEQRILSEPEDLETELMRGFAIEGSGWKSRRGTAILDSSSTTTFYRDVAFSFARLGKLRLSTLSVGGTLAAFNLNLLDHDRIWGLKGGYDPTYAPYAPGLTLVLAEVERCFELGLSSLELLGGAEPWKRKLTRDTRQHWTIASFTKRPLPLFQYGLQLVEPRARHTLRWLRRRRGLH